MSYYVIIPYSYMMRMLYEKEGFLLLVVFGVGTHKYSQISTHACTHAHTHAHTHTHSVGELKSQIAITHRGHWFVKPFQTS